MFTVDSSVEDISEFLGEFDVWVSILEFARGDGIWIEFEDGLLHRQLVQIIVE